VCLWKEGELHATILTAADGVAAIPVRVRLPGMAHLTVTAHNHLPFEGRIDVGSEGSGPGLTLADLAVADEAEGFLDAGEKAPVRLALWNGGKAPVNGATARITGVEGKVRVVEGATEFPVVPAGGAAVSTKPIVLQAASDAPPGHRAVLKVEMKGGSGKTWAESIPVYVNASWVVRLGQTFIDKDSDGDGQLTMDDCGTTVDLSLEVGNLGSGCARDVKANITIRGSGIRVKNPTVSVGDVPVGARIPLPEPFHLIVSDSFGGPPLECKISFTSKTGTPRTEEFYIEEPLDPPKAPTSRGREHSVDLKWEPVESERITGYNVYRADRQAGAYKRVNPTMVTASCFEDSGLPRTTEFWYRVTALDRSLNESPPSEPVKAKTIYGQQRDWPKKTSGNVAQLAFADLDNDGDPEIGTGNNMGPWVWHHTGQEVHHGGDYWTFGLFVRTRGSTRTPTFADVDGKGNKEVITITHEGGRPRVEMVNGQPQVVQGSGGKAKLHVWGLDGKELKGWPKELGGSTRFPVLAADLDSDGKVELVILLKNGTIQAFKADGSKFGSGSLGKASKDAKAGPAVADLDGDGDMEIAGLDGKGKLYAFHHDGSSAGPSFDAKSAGSYTVAGDLDGDTKPELVFCAEEGKKIVALKGDGTPLAGFPAELDAGKGTLRPVLADLDGDGAPEILVTGNKKVFAFKGDGSAVPGFPVECGESTQGLAVGDVDGDRSPDVVVALRNGVLGFCNDGSPLHGWPLEAPEVRNSIRTVPLIADVDLDGDVDILVGANSHVLIWDLPAQFDPGRIEWGAGSDDTGRTGLWKTPMAPPGAATITGTGKPSVSWAAVEGAAGYHVFRGKAGGPLGRITKAPVSNTTYVDSGATGGAAFRFAVCAVGPSGRPSPLSAPAEWEDSRPAGMLQSGESAAKSGDAKKAAQSFQAILRDYPDSRHAEGARRGLGGLGEAAGGSTAGAAGGVRRYVVLGDRWLDGGFKNAARACYEKVIALSPDGPAADEARLRLASLKD
jgi:hypothetical protein